MAEDVKVALDEVTEFDKIFRTLMHFPGSTFSDLWDKRLESNKFTYYLKKMEKEGLLEKKDGKYYLTVKGKAEASTIDGATGKKPKRPFVALLIVPRKDGKYIAYTRMKEPYYGAHGFPGGKVEFGEDVLFSAKRELSEEMGLEGEGKIAGIQNVIVVKEGKTFAHFTQFVVLFDNPQGELVKENREGTYEWALRGEVLAQKNLFMDIPGVIESIEGKEFFIRDIVIHEDDSGFTGFESKKLFSCKT